MAAIRHRKHRIAHFFREEGCCLLVESAMMSKCRRCSSLAGACVLLLQRDGAGGQVVDALGGGGVLGRLCRRARREPGRLRGHQ